MIIDIFLGDWELLRKKKTVKVRLSGPPSLPSTFWHLPRCDLTQIVRDQAGPSLACARATLIFLGDE